MMRLRGHHLFCTTLFQGKGYDQRFVERMEATLAALEQGESFRLCQEGDALCDACPNQTEEGCSLGTADVRRRDQAALKAVGLAPGDELTLAQVGRRLGTVTQESWRSVCGGCRWAREGLCSWEQFQTAVKKRFG